MTEIDYGSILSQFYPNDEWTVTGAGYRDIVWQSGSEKPTDAHLAKLLERAEQDRKAQEAAAIATYESMKTKVMDALGFDEVETAAFLGPCPVKTEGKA